MSLESRRNALAISVGWWLLRRKLRKRAHHAVSGLIAGEGISHASAPRRHQRLRGVLVTVALTGGGLLAWRRLRGGPGDDGGAQRPEQPSPAPASPPTSEPDPVAV
jgi:hypothetical protein